MNSKSIDDTFKALKKLPFSQLLDRRLREYPETYASEIPEAFFCRLGWSKVEFYEELLLSHKK